MTTCHDAPCNGVESMSNATQGWLERRRAVHGERPIHIDGSVNAMSDLSTPEMP